MEGAVVNGLAELEPPGSEVTEGEADPDGTEGVEPGSPVDDPESDGAGDGVAALPLGVGQAVADGVLLGEADGVTLADVLPLGIGVTHGVGVGLADALALAEPLALPEALAEGFALDEAGFVALPAAPEYGAFGMETATPPRPPKPCVVNHWIHRLTVVAYSIDWL